VLYRACEAAFGELDRAEEQMAKGRGLSLGSIRLGATVEFGTTLLVKYLKGFLAANPGVHVDFHFSHDLLQPLLTGEIDMAIDCKLHRAEGLQRVPLFREEYAVIASPAFLRRHPVKEPRALERCAVLSLDKAGAWWGNFLNALPPGERPDLRDLTEMDHIRAIVNAAIESIGVGFVPKYCVLKELKAGTLVDVFPQLQLLEDTFYVYQKPGRAALERHRGLVAYLKQIRTTQLEHV
jgi:DNA-binding transcriptional LysR family regulator